MNLRHLETFVTIVESGTLTEAARRLYKTQGAVSHDLKALEDELGVMLIDRSGQRIELTSAGETLLPVVSDVLRRVREVGVVGRKLKQGELGVLRVGTLTSLGPFVLDHLVEFRAEHPDLRFALSTALQTTLVESLLDGRLDLVIAQPDLSSRLDTHLLGPEEAFVVVQATDSLAERETIEPGDVIDRPFVGFLREQQSTRAAEEFFRSLGRYPDPVVELEDFRLMRDLIADGHAYGILAAAALVTDPDPRVVGVPSLPPLIRSLAVLTDPRREDVSVPLLFEHLTKRWRSPTYVRPGPAA